MAGKATSNVGPTPDYSQLKSPLQLGTTGLKQLLQCYQVGTQEVRETLMHECDVIVECKVCRSLYRGLPNFLSHKRHYCTKQHADTLVRFQEMPTKEDQFHIFGSSVFGAEPTGVEDEEDDLTLSKKARRRKPNADKDAQLHSYFKGIHKAGLNMTREQSSDRIIELNTMAETSNAVTQNVLSSRDVLRQSQGNAKKRKHTDSDPTYRPTEGDTQAVNGDASDFLNGVESVPFPEQSTMQNFFVYVNLCAEAASSNKCLKCKEEFASFKALKMHMKSSHVKRRSFYQCQECPKLFVSYDRCLNHITGHHRRSYVKALDSFTQIEKLVVDNRFVYDGFKVISANIDASQSNSLNGSVVNGSGDEDEESIDYFDEVTEVQSHDNSNETLSDHEDQASDDQDASKHSNTNTGYLCTKTFWLAIIRALGLFDDTHKDSKRRYRCVMHPTVAMTKYTSFKDHIMQEHIRPKITCPICKESFSKPACKYFTNFAIHLKLVHNITESKVSTMSQVLRMNVLKGKFPNADDQEEAIIPNGNHERGTGQVHADDRIATLKGSVMSGHHEQSKEQVATMKPTRKPTGLTGQAPSLAAPENGTIHHNGGAQHTPESHLAAKHNSEPYISPSRQRQALALEGGQTSVFNLEDFYCPLCPRHFPRIHQVISHLVSGHGCDRQEALKYKAQIHASHIKQQQQKVQVLINKYSRSSRVSSRTASKENLAEGQAGMDGAAVKRSRKQESPIKNKDMVITPERLSVSSDMNCRPAIPSSGSLTTGNVTFSSRFSLHQCLSCQKVFGQKSLLDLHKKSCHLENDKATDISGITNLSSSVDGPTKASELSDDRHMSHMRCSKCNRLFQRKMARIMHEKICRGILDPSNRKSSPDKDKTSVTVDEYWQHNNSNDTTGSERFHKLYKCPLCDQEDAELHNINAHLVQTHGWSGAKVAARYDILKRSFTLRPVEENKAVTTEYTSNTSLPLSNDPNSNSQDESECPRSVSPFRLHEFECHLCPRVYAAQHQLTTHWHVTHGLENDEVIQLRQEMQLKKNQMILNIQDLPRSARRASDVKNPAGKTDANEQPQPKMSEPSTKTAPKENRAASLSTALGTLPATEGAARFQETRETNGHQPLVMQACELNGLRASPVSGSIKT